MQPLSLLASATNSVSMNRIMLQRIISNTHFRSVALSLIVSIALFVPCAEAKIEVIVSGRSEKLSSFSRGDITYYSLSGFAALYGEQLSWDIVGQSVNYQFENINLRMYIGSPYVSVNDTVRNVIYPCVLKDGALFVPAETFTSLLDKVKSERITWNANRRSLTVTAGRFNITDLTISEKANGLLIELYLTEKLEFNISESEGAWLNISLPNGRVNRSLIESRRRHKALRDVNAFQFDRSAQISIRLKKKPHSYSAKYHPESGRIQLSVRNSTFTPTSPPRKTGNGEIGPDRTIDLIVIDPGHGGDDNGAIGRGFTKEKDIVLQIAKELAKLIRKDKLFKVILTRDKDVYLPLEKRAKIANDAQADLFLSIHLNANINRQASGSQVFFLAPAKTDGARALAQAENARFLTEEGVVDLEPDDDVSVILHDMIQNVYEVASADLSAIIQSEFRRSLGIPARGVDQAGFVVLNEVFMPSALLEVAFVSNPREEKLLRQKKFRKKVAQAIYAGLKRFKKKYESSF